MPIADMVLTADTSQVKTATQVVDKFRASLLKLAKNQQELEKTLKETKPQYKEYIQKTNSFFPWFPKK